MRSFCYTKGYESGSCANAPRTGAAAAAVPETPRGTKPEIHCDGSGGPDSVPRRELAFAYLLKTACTDVSLATLSAQIGAVPEHAPDQLTNVLPAGGVAVSVTIVP